MRTVSVIIPSYNYGRFIKEAIDSALGQTYAPLEVVVVDDGSTDDTSAVVAEFGELVRYIKQENAGVCAARNRGVAESGGELIAFLDADDIWEPTKLEKQIAKFDDPEVGLVHSGVRIVDYVTGKTLRTIVTGCEDEAVLNLLLWEEPGIPGPAGTIVLPRSLFEQIGGFDTRMKCGEDWDFCYRIAKKSKVRFIAEPLVIYRSHNAAAHRNVENMEAGMSLFYEKAFAQNDPEIVKWKNRALGNFHKVLAGSYFHQRKLGKFLEHTFQSIARRPANLGYFLAFPLRRLSRNSDSFPPTR